MSEIAKLACEAMWPFIGEELGQYVAKEYADAIKAVADALGKEIVFEKRAPIGLPEMYYIKELQP